MEWTYLRQEDYVVSRWSGGATAQIAIAPEGAAYGKRDFLWRVSSASVETEESEFTSLPDYVRWISTLTGGMELSHQGGEKIALSPYQVHRFDGGVATHSWGRCTDFNLMLRKGKAEGLVRAFRLGAGCSRTLLPESPEDERFTHVSLLLLCGEGRATAVLDGTRVEMEPFSSLVVRNGAEEGLGVEAAEDAVFLLAEIRS